MPNLIEVFSGVQGEGKLVGTPTTFIRFAKCNLSCSFCDTKYSWGEGIYWEDDKIIEKVKEFKNDYVCISGGEPLVSYGDVIRLSEKLCKLNYFTTIETNGSIYLKESQFFSFVTCSPKFVNGEWKYEQLNDLVVDEFKFVVENENDVRKVLEYFNHVAYKISLMPKAATREEYLLNAPVVWQLCEKYKLHFSPREHIVLFDVKRGV